VPCFSLLCALRGRLKVSQGTILLEKGSHLGNCNGHRVFHKALVSDTESCSAYELNRAVYSQKCPMLPSKPKAVCMCLSPGTGISPNTWIWGTCPVPLGPAADSSALPPHHLSRGCCTESQNHRMFRVGRDLCGSSSPTPLLKQGHLQQAVEDFVQVGLEYLQRRRIHNLSGQPVPVLHHPQNEEDLPHVQLELPMLQFVPVAPCPVAGHH